MVWTAISWNFLGFIVALHDRTNGKDYLTIGRSCSSNGPCIILSDGDGISQDGNDPIHAVHVVKYQLEHMEWPSQSPDLNITNNLWCVLEPQVRNRYPLPLCLKESGQVLMKKWLKIPLEEVRKLFDSILRLIEAIQKAG